MACAVESTGLPTVNIWDRQTVFKLNQEGFPTEKLEGVDSKQSQNILFWQVNMAVPGPPTDQNNPGLQDLAKELWRDCTEAK